MWIIIRLGRNEAGRIFCLSENKIFGRRQNLLPDRRQTVLVAFLSLLPAHDST